MLRFFKRLLAILAAAALLTLGALAEPAALTVTESTRRDDGVLRVLLRSMKGEQTLHLTLAGNYTVDGDRPIGFDRGMEATLSVDGGEIWLSAGGLRIGMGESFTLTRHAADGENGLYIAESETGSLYMGDLTVSAEDGALRAVLSIAMEDYLLGVVAYEMSDSFPLEALKAQAVAARTYALRRKAASASRDWDVTDTTSDQVFKGYNPEYQNVAEAVSATSGVVGAAPSGAYAECYYTASNGGQIARPGDIWGGADDGCIEMKDDPCDLENPRSMVSSIQFSADLTGAGALKALLTDALREVEPEAALVSVANIEALNPAVEGSYMYRTLAFDLNVTLPAPSPEPTAEPTPAPGDGASPWSSFREGVSELSEEIPAPTAAPAGRSFLFLPTATPEPQRAEATVRVELSVYDQIKKNLGLGLNGGDYELISVRHDGDSFALEMRRFGHGVGMSQRGAQWMAGHYGKNWREILAFYYPNMALERIDWNTPALTETFAEVEAPLPEAEDGERVAAVALDNASSMLNVRAEPSAEASVLGQLKNGRQVLVSGEPDGDGWVRVRTAEWSGWCKAEYLTGE